jgi:hypothetical protein
MNDKISLKVSEYMPTDMEILGHQGIKEQQNINPQITDLVKEAKKIFKSAAKPAGVMVELSLPRFDSIFMGESLNERMNPLQQIYPQAERLALFAITMGSKISDKIENLFDKNDFAIASMLDGLASLAADKAVENLEKRYYKEIYHDQPNNSDLYVLSYSPGYCGWDISGQKKIFRFLKPERIGMSLNQRYLMTPLKSVTGVLIAGKKEIHLFNIDFPFCRHCKDFSCRKRIKTMLNT